MAGNGGAGAQLGLTILQDYLERRNESAICTYLELADEAPLGGNPFAGFMRRQWCQPPSPPSPPSSDFFNAGGVPCRLYRVTFLTGSPGDAGTESVVDRLGPIGLIKETGSNPDGTPTKRFILTSGTGSACPRNAEVVAGTSNSDVVDVFCRITSIVPLEGTPETEIPIYRPDVDFPETDIPPITVNIPFNIDGFDIDVPINFSPPVPSPFGVVIPFTFSPTANFNPQIDIDLGLNPQFGLDINFEFVVPIGGSPTNPLPIPGEEPVDLPPITPPNTNECEEFDYERIEKAIQDARCCKPITDVVNVGSFTFETPNDVAVFSVPNNTVAVFIGIQPGENTRAYKFAGANSEYGHGNASLMVSGDALGFERLYVNNHVLFFPEETSNKGIRISCVEGTVVSVNAGLFIPVEEV